MGDELNLEGALSLLERHRYNREADYIRERINVGND